MKALDAEALMLKDPENWTPDERTELAKYYRRELRSLATYMETTERVCRSTGLDRDPVAIETANKVYATAWNAALLFPSFAEDFGEIAGRCMVVGAQDRGNPFMISSAE
jgi:hypothetical protein